MGVKRDKGVPKRPRGRPTLYDPVLAMDVCARISAGESLRSICEPEDMPAESTVRLWNVDDVNGFSAHYARACRMRAERWAEEIIGIADDASRDTLTSDEGEERANSEWINRSRLRVDARKWIASKLLPKVYGDKVEVEHSGKLMLESLLGESWKAEGESTSGGG